jgi:hypothetical protein
MKTSFRPPRRTPSQRGHLERLAQQYGRTHGLAIERTRRWLSIVSLAGALETVQTDDGPQFLIKGGTSMEIRLGAGARTTKDVDIVFRGEPEEMLDALEEAFESPYGAFSFRRKGTVDKIRDTGSRRLAIQVEFAGSSWQTLQLEVAQPEIAEAELVPVAISVADFKLEGPERVACLSLRYQVAQKLHAVTEQPPDRENLRFWDLIDLILLRELLGEDDLASVREACVKTFAYRRIHAWPPDLVAPASWADPYATAIEEVEGAMPADVEIAADEVRAFITEIDQSAADQAGRPATKTSRTSGTPGR